MIRYLAPGRGRGHTTRAVSICRHLEHEVTIYATTHQREILDWSGLAYEIVTRAEMLAVAHDTDDPVIGDLPYNPHAHVDGWVWRLGYGPRGPGPTLLTEGPGALWPIVLLLEDELLDRDTARAELGLPAEGALTCLVPNELHLPKRIRAHYDYVLDRFPALRWLRAFDHVVGSPGQLFNEAAAAGVPGTWLSPYDLNSTWERANQVLPEKTPDAAVEAARWVENLVTS